MCNSCIQGRPWVPLQYCTWFYLTLCPLFPPFLLYHATICERDFWVIPSWVYPSIFSHSWAFVRSHYSPLSLALSLPPISVFENFSNGVTALPSPSLPANHLLPTWGCHFTPSFSSSRTSFLLCFFHLRHRINRFDRLLCYTTPPDSIIN